MEKVNNPVKVLKEAEAKLDDKLDADLKKAKEDSKEGSQQKEESGEQNERKEDMIKEADEAAELELADKTKREAKKEEIEKKDKYRDEYFEEMKGYKSEKKGEKETSPKTEEGEKVGLEALSKELEKARGEYIKNDFKMDRKSKKFSKLFGFRTGLGNYKEEIENYKSSYEEALKNYKDAVIDSEYVEDKESVEIATRGFIIGERLNRESVRADLEAGETGWSKTLMKRFSGLTEGYKKLSFKKKLLIGVGVAGVGIASSAIGGAVAIGGTGFIGGYRAFTMGISSAGFSQIFETMAQKGKGKKAEREVKNIEDLKFEGSEADYKRLNEALDKNIEEVNSKIQKEKQWKVWRRYMGVGAGVGMSIVFRYLGKEIAEHFQGRAPEVSDGAVGESGINSEAIKGQVEQALHDPKYDTLGGSEVNSEAIEDQVKQALHDPKFDTLGETAAGVEATEVVGGVEIAKSGDSVWKLAENQLESRGYFKGLTGTPEEILAKKTYLTDAIKDKIVENPKDFGMTDANKLQIGQKVDFSSIFENKNDIGNIIDKAESLGKGDIESITQNLAGESPSHGVGAETAGIKTETPAAEASKMEVPAEMSEIEMQNQQLAEMKIAHALGLDPREYSAINDVKVGKFLNEINNPNKDWPDLPHHGAYGSLEKGDHFRLAEFIKGQLNNVPEGDRLSVKEFLMKVDLESLPADSAIMTKHFSFEDGFKYLAGVLQQETAETIKTCAGNVEDWNNVKNVPAINFIDPETGEIQNEVVRNLKTAAAKILPEGAAVPLKNDTVENWMIKVVKEAYKRGTLDELREQLIDLRK